MNESPNHPPGERDNATLFIAGTCGILLILHLSAKIYFGTIKDGVDAVTLGLTAVGLSPWIASVLESFKFGGVEFKFVQQQLAKQQGDIDALRFLIANFLTFWELHHLTELAAGREFTADMEYWPDNLKAELGRLRSLGFLEPKAGKGLNRLFSDSGRYKNVHEYLQVTSKGRAYLTLLADAGISKEHILRRDDNTDRMAP
jgi:hypothetical protein